MDRFLHACRWLVALGALAGVAFGFYELLAYEIDSYRHLVVH